MQWSISIVAAASKIHLVTQYSVHCTVFLSLATSYLTTEWIYIATYNLVFQALIGWLGVNLSACIFQRLYLSHMTKLISAAM
jgi:hypothetical protein